jgi:hypothetical protein
LAENVNVASDVPPPGVGLKTVTEAVFAMAMSAAGTVAVSEVALTKVVGSAEPFQFTTEVLTKLDPVAVNVKPEPPSFMEVGEIEVRIGAGLLIENVCPAEVPPPGAALTAVTEAVPALEISEAGTEAVTEVALTKVVTSGTPFQLTTVPLTKFVPVSVSVNAPLATVVDVGLMDVSAGAGLSTANV